MTEKYVLTQEAIEHIEFLFDEYLFTTEKLTWKANLLKKLLEGIYMELKSHCEKVFENDHKIYPDGPLSEPPKGE